MLPFPSALMRATRASATRQLTLEFALGTYSDGTINSASIEDLPGYAFTRSGEQGAWNSTGAVAWFPANVPAINDRGYHAHGALTNFVLRSSEFGTAPWAAWSDVSLTGTDVAVAPDGSTAADQITFTSNAGIYYQSTAVGAVGQTVTMSIWVRVASGTMPFRLYVLDGSNRYSPDFTATTTWQRFSFTWTLVSGAGTQFAIAGASTPMSGALQIWHAQMLLGDFPDGGPLIRTAGSMANIGASALALNLANGTYDATYTFDDASTQVVPVTVGDGLLRHPVAGVLNRGAVRKTVVAAA